MGIGKTPVYTRTSLGSGFVGIANAEGAVGENVQWGRDHLFYHTARAAQGVSRCHRTSNAAFPKMHAVPKPGGDGQAADGAVRNECAKAVITIEQGMHAGSKINLPRSA